MLFFLQGFQCKPSHPLQDGTLPLEERYMHHPASWQFKLQVNISMQLQAMNYDKEACRVNSEKRIYMYTVKLYNLCADFVVAQ